MSLVILYHCFFYSLLIEIYVSDKAHDDLQNCRTRDCKSNLEKRSVTEMLHQKGYRNSYKKRSAYSLNHNKLRFLYSVIISDITEKEACLQTVNGIGFQIIPCIRYSIGVVREYSCQQVTSEISQQKHRNSKNKRYSNSAFECFFARSANPAP